MLTAKDIIEMEEHVIHSTEPRKRSGTINAEERIRTEMPSELSSSSNKWNPALASRRASVPMEIIIGGIITITIDTDGKPIFTATPSSTVGSPVLTDRRQIGAKEKKKADGKNVTKKRSTSQKKKTVTTPTTLQKTTKKREASDKDKESSEESPTSLMNNSMATCSIGTAFHRSSKKIEHLPEYELSRKELVVTVRDAIIQTDLF